MSRLLASAGLGALLLSSNANVAEAQQPPAEVEAYKLHRVATEHAGIFGDRKVRYVATAGETLLRDPKGDPAATIFAFSYVEKNAKEARPVVLVSNGGPSSSSIWHAAMRRNPAMQVFIGAGYYDLVTTFGAAEYTVRAGARPVA